MHSERTQRRIDALLDRADSAADAFDWAVVAEAARAVLAMDPENEDAPPLLRAAEANLVPPLSKSTSGILAAPDSPSTVPPQPEAFAGGRYQVRRFLGEGGKRSYGPRLGAGGGY
jgi:hypothetical protein